MTLKIITCFLIMVSLNWVVVSHSLAGTDPVAFMNVGVGARALGLGGAFVAVSDDTTSIYWNPAGLGSLNRYSVAAMGQSLGSPKWDTLSDVTPRYQFIGISFPVKSLKVPFVNNDSSTFGFGILNSNLANIPYTFLDGSGNIVRDTFEDYESAYYLSLGMPFSEFGDNIFIGTTFKYIMQNYSKIPDASASGYDIDAGMQYVLNDLRVGVVLSGGAQMKWANGHRDSGPMVTKFGVSNNFTLNESFSLLGCADLIQKREYPVLLNTGAELKYSGFNKEKFIGVGNVFVRMGFDGIVVEDRYGYMKEINNSANFNTGFGINITFGGYLLKLDYVTGFYRLGNKNRVSINLYL